MYKRALKIKLRFATPKGKLTVEDLFSLNLIELNDLAVGLDKKLSETPRKSFISDIEPNTAEDELRLNILKDIIVTKIAEKNATIEAKNKAAEKAQIAEILHRKKNQELENLSIEELEAKLKSLN